MDPYQPQVPPPAPEPRSGMSTGAKVGIGIAIGCAAAVLVLVLVLAFMGACTCSACSSCCAEMSKAAQHAQEMEEREAAKLREVGETVQVGSVSVTVSDAQRQGETVVVTADVQNESFTEVTLGPGMFRLEDSSARSHEVDMEKASLTMDGIEEDQPLAAEQSVTVRAVFTVPADSTGLILEVKAPDYGYGRRRYKLGL
jgi:hypothetical protein